MSRRSMGMWLFTLVFGTFWLVLGGSPASAHTNDPVSVGGASAAPSTFGTSALFKNAGGWSGGNKFVMSPLSQYGNILAGRTRLSETYLLSEPYASDSGTRISVALQGSRPDSDGPAGQLPLRFYAYELVAYCKSSLGLIVKNYMGAAVWHNATDSGLSEIPVRTHIVCGADAPNLVAIEFVAATEATSVTPGFLGDRGSYSLGGNQSRFNPATPNATNVFSEKFVVTKYSRMIWYPGVVIDYTPFDNALTDYGDGNIYAICIANPAAAQCQVVNRWAPYDSAASWSVCENAPGASWTSFDWLPGWVGHYAKCLFVPSAGFPTDPVLWEIENSDLGSVKVTVEGVVAALPHVESCGVIIDTQIQGAPLKFDTCSLSAWAPAKTYIGWASIILAGFSSLNLLISVLMRREMRTDDGE